MSEIISNIKENWLVCVTWILIVFYSIISIYLLLGSPSIISQVIIIALVIILLIINIFSEKSKIKFFSLSVIPIIIFIHLFNFEKIVTFRLILILFLVPILLAMILRKIFQIYLQINNPWIKYSLIVFTCLIFTSALLGLDFYILLSIASGLGVAINKLTVVISEMLFLIVFFVISFYKLKSKKENQKL